jgi:hypothetical protein
MLGSILSRFASFVCGVMIAGAMGVVLASDTWAWRDVAAEAPIDHAVMVRGPFDDAHRKMRVAGPVAVTASNQDAGPCFTVYAVTNLGDEPQRTARVGAGGAPLQLGSPAFVLVPARQLRDGERASEPPPGVYEVRPVLDPPPEIDGGPDAAGPPAYVCLPVDYRHHFERVPVAVADRGLVIFASRDVPPDIARVATADDFGIAKLTARGTGRTATWLPVRPVLDDVRP